MHASVGENFLYQDQGTLPAVGCARRRPSRRLLSSPRLRLGPRRAYHEQGGRQLPGRGRRACGPRQQEARHGVAVELAKQSEPVGAWMPWNNRGDFGTAGPAPAFRARAGAPTPREQRAPCRRIDAGSATVRPWAPRPESSAPDPHTDTVPSCTRHYVAERSEREERKADASGGPPQGSSNEQAAVLGWWRVNSDLPLARHPEGCQTPADTSSKERLTRRPAPGRTRVCRPRGRSEQPRYVGCGQGRRKSPRMSVRAAGSPSLPVWGESSGSSGLG